MKHPRVAILASGEGTTAEAFINAGVNGLISTQVGLIICNNEQAGIFRRVQKLNKQYDLDIECIHISKKNFPAKEVKPGEQTEAEENAILNVLKAGRFDAVALMGYIKKVGPGLVYEFGWRNDYENPYQAMMVNTHPGLLPATKGMYGVHVQEFVLQNNLKYTGQTLHIVAEDYDVGPTIAEHKVIVRQNDTPASLFERVKKTEKKSLPKDIDDFINKRIKYLGRLR